MSSWFSSSKEEATVDDAPILGKDGSITDEGVAHAPAHATGVLTSSVRSFSAVQYSVTAVFYGGPVHRHMFGL